MVTSSLKYNNDFKVMKKNFRIKLINYIQLSGIKENVRGVRLEPLNEISVLNALRSVTSVAL